MIFIVVKFSVKPEAVDQWLDTTRTFTEATRSEPGNLWFDWYHGTADPNEYVLIEGFKDPVAGSAHVSSAHFAAGLETMRPLLATTPSIISRNLEDLDGWSPMGELQID